MRKRYHPGASGGSKVDLLEAPEHDHSRDRHADPDGAVHGAFTAGTCLTAPLRASLAARGIGEIAVEAMPLPMQ